MLVNICMNFHEDAMNGFQVTERTRFCDGRTDGRTDDRAKIMSPNHNGGDLICLAQVPDAAYQALRSLALWVQRSF